MLLLLVGIVLCMFIVLGWKKLTIAQRSNQIDTLDDFEQSQIVPILSNDTIDNEQHAPSIPMVVSEQNNFDIIRSTLEFLPDEILLEMIEYLKPYDIYHSLHNLNERFNLIINDFQLCFHLDVSHISKAEFDYCLSILLPRPSVMSRLHSLCISNHETYGAINVFLRHYPNLILSHLRSLSLIDATATQCKSFLVRLSTQITHISIVTNRTMDVNDKRSLCQLLLTHSSLRSCRLSLCDGVDCDETILSNSNNNNNQLEEATIDLSYFQNILTFLPLVPRLRRLTININQQKYYNQDYDAAAFDVFRLLVPNQLVYFNLNLGFSNVEFEHIEELLICLVNLKHLCCSSFRAELVDGYRWARVIEHLPLLRRFECVMTTYIYHSLDLNSISQSFRTEFWQSNNWPVVCDYFHCLSRLTIYTIPFYKTLFTSTLNGCQDISSSSSIRFENAYDKVTHLKVSVQGLHSDSMPTRRFRSVTSLSLCDGESYSDHSNSSLLSYLTATIDLSRLHHLKLYSLFPGHTLFTLLCQAPNIYCLSSSYHNLLQMINDFGDVWLCWLLNTMITKLTLSYGRLTLSIVDQFVRLFSNIEHLSLCMHMDDIDFQHILDQLLQHLPRLTSIRISLAGKLTDNFQMQTLAWLTATNRHLHSEFNENFLDMWIT